MTGLHAVGLGRTRRELASVIIAARRQHLGDGSVVADEVNEKGPPQRVVDAFVCQKVAGVKEVTLMLLVECGDDLFGAEIPLNLCLPWMSSQTARAE